MVIPKALRFALQTSMLDLPANCDIMATEQLEEIRNKLMHAVLLLPQEEQVELLRMIKGANDGV